MIKKIVVAGCRHYNNYNEAKKCIDFYISEIKKENKLVFISGGCRGADMLGERYARDNGYEIKRFLADWDKYGPAAGPIRNKEMAQAADCVICFWDGKSAGTKSMIECTKQFKKSLRIKYI